MPIFFTMVAPPSKGRKIPVKFLKEGAAGFLIQIKTRRSGADFQWRRRGLMKTSIGCLRARECRRRSSGPRRAAGDPDPRVRFSWANSMARRTAVVQRPFSGMTHSGNWQMGESQADLALAHDVVRFVGLLPA